MTTVFISRHSEPFRDLLGNYNANETLQIRNEKNPLSVEGELKSKRLSELKELQDIDVIYSSHYVRAMATAKYISEKNDIKLDVDERFGERKFGINDWSLMPKDFFEHQALDWDYKIGDGESLNEVSFRIKDALIDVLNNYKGKKIMIVSHGTALTTMLKDWCDIKLNMETKNFNYYFKDKLFFEGKWGAPELFKLEFDDENRLCNIENIKL